MRRPAADALDLVGSARDVLRHDSPSTAGLWPRASAALARQAIEMSMDDLWQLRAPGLQYTSTRCQLLCLRDFLGDSVLAGRAAAAYAGLSRAMHHHPYELPPTHGELLGWVTTAWDLANAVGRTEAGAARR